MCLHCVIHTGVIPYRHQINSRFHFFSENIRISHFISGNGKSVREVRWVSGIVPRWQPEARPWIQTCGGSQFPPKKSTESIDSTEFLVNMAKVIDTSMHSKWKPNTVRTYLNSLRLFIDFLINMSVLGIPDFSYNVAILQTSNKKCLKWCNSCIKGDKKTMSTTAATRYLLTPADLQTYLESNRARQHQTYLMRALKGKSVWLATRLWGTIWCSNCQRMGCFRNMTVDKSYAGQDGIQRRDHHRRHHHHRYYCCNCCY